MCVTENNPSEPCCDSAAQRCKKCPATDWSAYTWRYEQPSADRGIYIPWFETSEWYRALYADQPEKPPIARFEATSFLMSYGGYCTWQGGPLRSVRPEDEIGNAVTEGMDSYGHFHASTGFVKNDIEFADGRPRWVHPFWPLRTVEIEIPLDMYVLDRDQWNCNGANRWIRNDENSPWDYPDVYPAWIEITRVKGRGTLPAVDFINQQGE